MDFLSDPQDGRPTLRPTNVMVYGWIGHKQTCVDLTEVSPLVRLRIRSFTVGHATIKVASSRVSKHDKGCSNNQHAFILFAIKTFDFLASEIVDLLQRVQRVMNRNIISHRSINIIFKIIGFSIPKNLTT